MCNRNTKLTRRVMSSVSPGTWIFFSGLVTDFSFQVLVFIAVHTVYTGNMLSQKPQEGKKGQQWEKREPVKVLKTLNDRQSYILSKLHKIETFQLILGKVHLI